MLQVLLFMSEFGKLTVYYHYVNVVLIHVTSYSQCLFLNEIYGKTLYHPNQQNNLFSLELYVLIFITKSMISSSLSSKISFNSSRSISQFQLKMKVEWQRNQNVRLRNLDLCINRGSIGPLTLTAPRPHFNHD